MSQGSDDISIDELKEQVAFMLGIIVVLLGGELAYRWLTDPTDSWAMIQIAVTWIWTSLHTLLFDADSVTVLESTYGLPTVLEFNHPAFDRPIALEVTDECVGVHEVLFVSILIAISPGVPRRLKVRGIVAMLVSLQVINMARLLVLYPLAVNGCLADPGAYGCEEPMWRFHEFMLRIGFMLLIVGGWLVWFVVVDGAGHLRRHQKRLEKRGPIQRRLALREELPDWSKVVLAIGLLVAAAGAYTLALDAEARQHKAEAAGCEEVISAACGRESREWDDISGKAFRQLLVGGVMVASAVVRIDEESLSDGEADISRPTSHDESTDSDDSAAADAVGTEQQSESNESTKAEEE